jgi:hypothetical protein
MIDVILDKERYFTKQPQNQQSSLVLGLFDSIHKCESLKEFIYHKTSYFYSKLKFLIGFYMNTGSFFP